MAIVFSSAGYTTSTPLLCAKASLRCYDWNLYPRMFTKRWEQNKWSVRLSASPQLHRMQWPSCFDWTLRHRDCEANTKALGHVQLTGSHLRASGAAATSAQLKS